MKALSSKIPKAINLGSLLEVADNSGAKLVRVVGVKLGKTRKGKQQACKLADLIRVSVRKGPADMRKQIFWATIVRQKKEFRRKTGERICFEDNAVVLLKDEDGNPKGTQIKGPIAREVSDKWPFVAKLASIII